DGSASFDPESLALSYLWNFGDGTTSTQMIPDHTFPASGTYPVTLTVTDPGGHPGSLTRDTTVSQSAGSVLFRAAAASNINTSAPTVTIPQGVQSGDALLLIATTNRLATMTTAPSGWTLLGVQEDGTDFKSWAFTRVAPAGAAGSTVTATLDANSKTSF